VKIICCVVDGTPLPIIHTHNGDGTFQNQPECICSLRYPACRAHAPYCHLWPAPLYIFKHSLI